MERPRRIYQTPERFKFRTENFKLVRKLVGFELAWWSEDGKQLIFPDLTTSEGMELFIEFLVSDFGMTECERPSQVPLSAERNGEYYIGKDCFWCIGGVWLDANSENFVPEGWFPPIEPSEVELKHLLALRYSYLTPEAKRLRDYWPTEIYNRRHRLQEKASSLRHSCAPPISELESTTT